MKRAYLLLMIVLTLSACEQINTSTNEDNTAVVVGDTNGKDSKNTEISLSTKGDLSKVPTEFLAQNESDLSAGDSETAYKMCAEALSGYYKAIWNGSEIDLDTYIDNENLKQYTQKKVSSQYDLFLKNKFTYNQMTGVDIDARQVEYFGGDKSFFYLKLDARVHKDIGNFAEPTEFLVQNSNGKLVIVDWYTSSKDSYDSSVRGDTQTIDNPDIWNNSEWVSTMN
ncbi:hypothetical protein [Paenibacillus sp. 276b]|uniref:hypothetical protein n=1 Tax=Paenibacillus sp. 276b TaxID=1566277 RepID=UPI0008955195|nr:hypothetical protein [Paenibacillus sp. 276b]SEB23643.1 hypothetical protein SAMN03159332_4888 [Paenibacillus sp. 276b]